MLLLSSSFKRRLWVKVDGPFPNNIELGPRICMVIENVILVIELRKIRHSHFTSCEFETDIRMRSRKNSIYTQKDKKLTTLSPMAANHLTIIQNKSRIH